MPSRLASAPRSDPLSGVELVLVDGNNLVHVLSRTAGGPAGPGAAERMPPSAVIGRIRGVIPAGVRVELIFDGPPRGGVTGRLATAFSVRYSGRASADSLIADVVARQSLEHGPASTWGVLVVTDDRALGDEVRSRGARTAGSRWLAGRVTGVAPGADAGRTGRPTGRRGPGAGPAGGGHGGAHGGPDRAAGLTTGRAAARKGTSIGHGRPPRRTDRDAC